MAPVEFEPAIPANERPQTYALDRATIWIGKSKEYERKIWKYEIDPKRAVLKKHTTDTKKG
jgi:hypothetical protein